jgi:hypothetical protein
LRIERREIEERSEERERRERERERDLAHFSINFYK